MSRAGFCRAVRHQDGINKGRILQMEIIRTKDLSFSYKDGDGKLIPVLKKINISVKKGEFVAVLGHNGSGKSTLARLINMILTEESGEFTGELYVCGKNITSDITEDEIYEVRRHIGMVHQNPDNQIVATTVEEDVAFGPENLGIPREKIRKRVDEALADVGMTEYLHHAPHRLSGGQKQRVAIAGIIAMRPDVIIFDESTAMLDPHGRADVMKIIKELHESGKTILLITHYMDEAAKADKIVVLNSGQVYKIGTPEEIFSDPEPLRRVRLDVPQVTELFTILKDAGLPIENVPNTTDDGVEYLNRIFESRKGEM